MAIAETSTRGDETIEAPREDVTAPFEIERLSNGKLGVRRDGTVTAVSVRLCLPWSEPGRYVSLRDEKNREVALINDVAELASDARAMVEQALAEAGFLFEIVRVESLDNEFEIRNWKVVTLQGPCTFQTELDDWPRALPNGGLLIKDVTGNLFFVRDPKALDGKSMKLLWVFVD